MEKLNEIINEHIDEQQVLSRKIEELDKIVHNRSSVIQSLENQLREMKMKVMSGSEEEFYYAQKRKKDGPSKMT